MKGLSVTKEGMIRHGLAVGAGLCLTAAFPNWNLEGAGWAGPGLLLFAAMGAPGRTAFRLGWLCGLVHALTSLSWLLAIPYTWLGLPLAPALGWVLLSAYVALYPAAWAWICWRLYPGGAASARDYAATPWWRRAAWALVCAVVWVALELMRVRFLTGFPWNPLGASQFRLVPLIQIAAYGGVYAVSFLMVWASVSIASVLVALAGAGIGRREPGVLPDARIARLPADAFPALLSVALIMGFGMHRVLHAPQPSAELKMALIQPSLDQTLIWDTNADAQRFETVMRLSRQAIESKPDVLVWPESAMTETSEENVTALANLAQSAKAWTVFCADDVELPRSGDDSAKLYNACFLLSPDGRLKARYRKSRLVIFGEYVPLVDWLPFLKWFVPAGSGYTPGKGPVQFRTENPDAQFSALICFEDVFPQEARRHVLAGTHFLLNLTNDGWFGKGAAQWQQAAAALFRAVENGVPLVRCSNNGLTCWIDPWGRIRQIAVPENIYGPGVVQATVPLYSSEERGRTFYHEHGDLFAWVCAGLAGWLLARSLARRHKNATQP